jgi:hypothetical protein
MQLPRVLINLEVDVSREVNESPETFPTTCAWAYFAGCTFMSILFWLLIQCSFPKKNEKVAE